MFCSFHITLSERDLCGFGRGHYTVPEGIAFFFYHLKHKITIFSEGTSHCSGGNIPHGLTLKINTVKVCNETIVNTMQTNGAIQKLQKMVLR